MSVLVSPDDDSFGDREKRRRNQQILAMRREGKSLREIANIVGLSHEAVALVCRKNGMGRVVLAQARSLPEDQRRRIVDAWVTGEHPRQIAEREGTYISTVVRVVDADATQAEREQRRVNVNVNRSRPEAQIPAARLYEAIRECADALGKVPTSADYRDYAQANQLPSVATIQKRLGWRKALTSAGFEPPQIAGRGPTFTDSECWDEVRALRNQLGRTPSIREYDRLVGHRPDKPGSQTVRHRCGGWANIVATLHAEATNGNAVEETKPLDWDSEQIVKAPDYALPVAKQRKGKWWKR